MTRSFITQALSLSLLDYRLISYVNFPYSNGGLDPWSGGGVTWNITDSLIAIVIPEGAHHLDLRASNPGDPKSVLQARALEVHYVKQWIEKSRHQH